MSTNSRQITGESVYFVGTENGIALCFKVPTNGSTASDNLTETVPVTGYRVPLGSQLIYNPNERVYYLNPPPLTSDNSGPTPQRLHLAPAMDSSSKAGIHHKKEFCNAFADLWKSKEFSDVEIHCSDGGVIKAHKFFLAVRSPVFREIFQIGMKESTVSVIKVKDTAKTTIEALLQYMYTGCVHDVEMEEMSKIVQAADKFQMEQLKTAAFATLVNRMNLATTADLVNLAYTYKASDKIKCEIQKFIIENGVDLSETESFKKMMDQPGAAFSHLLYGVFNESEG